jgi:ElaB/YqjD/DUF883 family membrane-anchored ribosome-binding protein
MNSMASAFLGRTNGMGENIRDKSHEMESQFENLSFNAGQAVGSAASNLVASSARGMRKGREYIIANPVAGVAIATTVGILAGSILTLAMRRRN